MPCSCFVLCSLFFVYFVMCILFWFVSAPAPVIGVESYCVHLLHVTCLVTDYCLFTFMFTCASQISSLVTVRLWAMLDPRSFILVFLLPGSILTSCFFSRLWLWIIRVLFPLPVLWPLPGIRTVIHGFVWINRTLIWSEQNLIFSTTVVLWWNAPSAVDIKPSILLN